jgi:ATP adenylyltransferase
MKYIMQDNPNPECIFCAALLGRNDPKSLVVHRVEHAYVILNRYPYTSGHLMVVPNAHIPSLNLLDEPSRKNIIDLLIQSEVVLQEVYRPDGLNVGANLGTAAGAGIAGHLHFHVVPRWPGDTNFMSSVGNTRVLPENLKDTYRRMLAGWKKCFP